MHAALGETAAQTYGVGRCQFQFSAAEIDVSKVRPSELSNAGLLIASLVCDGRELMDLNMVVQVQQQGGELFRMIYNPLDA